MLQTHYEEGRDLFSRRTTPWHTKYCSLLTKLTISKTYYWWLAVIATCSLPVCRPGPWCDPVVGNEAKRSTEWRRFSDATRDRRLLLFVDFIDQRHWCCHGDRTASRHRGELTFSTRALTYSIGISLCAMLGLTIDGLAVGQSLLFISCIFMEILLPQNFLTFHSVEIIAQCQHYRVNMTSTCGYDCLLFARATFAHTRAFSPLIR